MKFMIPLLLLAGIATAENLPEAVDGFLASDAPRRMTDSYLVADEPADESWKIDGNFGLTVTDGNSDTITLSAGLNASKTWAPYKLILGIRSIYAESNSVQSANEHIFTERLEYQLSEISWLFQDFLFEHDDEENLRYRLIFTVGYRRQLVKKEGFELFGEIGAGVKHDEFRTSDTTEAIIHLGLDLKWDITDKLVMTWQLRVYPSISEGGEFRITSLLVFSTPVSDRIDAKLTIFNQLDTNAPAGIEEHDITVTLSLSFKIK